MWTCRLLNVLYLDLISIKNNNDYEKIGLRSKFIWQRHSDKKKIIKEMKRS